MLIAATCVWLMSGQFTHAQEVFPTATDFPALDAPTLDSTWSSAAPLRIARPFDTGPQAGRSEPFSAPFDVLQPSPYGPFFPGAPFAPSAIPPDYVPPSQAQAYEFDSFEQNIFSGPNEPQWWGRPWWYTFANGHVTWVQGNGDSLGFLEFERRLLIANPLWAPYRLVPGFVTRYISGPTSTDLPPYVTEFSLELAATYQLDDDWTLDLGIRPGLNGDLSYVDADTFRLQGHAVAARPLSPVTQGVIGFVYLAREDIPALPVAGLMWRPNPDVKWELVFPRPRVATRVGGLFNEEGWLYVKGELGGNSWSIERANGHRDVATYRDLRLCLGYETLLPSGIAFQAETGWVFSRKLMYASGTPDFTPNDTFLIRVGVNF